MFHTSYLTLAHHSQASIDRKGSKFIGYAYVCSTESEAKNYLNTVKELHPKATHHCYAYIIGANKEAQRSSDDGEPSGTAGKPIFNALLSADITNVLVVVVRYYGGTMLGVPGLIEAYKAAAKAAIEANKIISQEIEEAMELSFDYTAMPVVMKLIKANKVTIVLQEIDNKCTLNIMVPKRILGTIIEALDGMVEVKKN